ncbi:MAG: ketopantoate reductase family protein [Clostridium sp.]|uniref:2-dehydropantoate 2-reductase N-terminal domain-containing protein n=1 Tax=Clostridium sp. TaxID=1506 RepID=UPI0025B8098C|nr:2-dehydropantoate 2-reductase N-terminal domain-containing protein [Clostridium sp.]MCH3964499.1 ketopantoate reductase family protein [Clostridium sp.]MCI1714971.1 ketopantoate reductase family protein [Clostridium sp.]MCI1799233.1 ketopantoate reductase family protein [Clostridium sp.]MCI1813154.1 ketopantoate reductase family protein [Clostridium sp.]MCI1870044.1 ketopantoate reductase family protein [Clostridium sp.]
MLHSRGNWKRSIDQNGLVIRHYGQMHTTKDTVKKVEELDADDKYDLIFVTMQYNQVLDILPQIAKNVSRHIVLMGNNMTPSHCQEQIRNQLDVQKEIAFGFQGTGGYRESKKVVSMHPFHVGMTIGGLREHLTSDFQKNIFTAFESTGYQLTWEQNMEGWLLSHAAHILPTAYLCYNLNCHLRRASKEQIQLAVDVIAEAHKMLKKLGYPIRPDGEEEAYNEKRKKKQRALYWMVKTPAGKYVISTHCAHAVAEMTALDQNFEKLKQKANVSMLAWDKLHTGAMSVIGNG